MAIIINDMGIFQKSTKKQANSPFLINIGTSYKLSRPFKFLFLLVFSVQSGLLLALNLRPIPNLP